MPQNVHTTIIATNLEVAMIGCKPTVEDFDYVHFALAEEKSMRGFFSSMPSIALNTNA
jgi:hypothetical protein